MAVTDARFITTRRNDNNVYDCISHIIAHLSTQARSRACDSIPPTISHSALSCLILGVVLASYIPFVREYIAKFGSSINCA